MKTVEGVPIMAFPGAGPKLVFLVSCQREECEDSIIDFVAVIWHAASLQLGNEGEIRCQFYHLASIEKARR